MRVRTLLACILVCFVALSVWAMPDAAEDPQRPSGQRRGGGRGGAAQLSEEELLENFDKIVELIWTDEEEDAWDRARSNEEKQAFIVSFWESRDPTPGTDANEFRDIYMARVAQTVRLFGREGTEGYRTSRGKFFIIYGGNAILEQETRAVSGSSRGGTEINPGAEAGGASAAGRGQNVIWTIDTTINPFLEDKDTITFAQYQRSYSMTTRGIELSQEAFLANRDVQEVFEGRRSAASAGGGGGGAAGPGAGAAAAPATPVDVAMNELMQQGVTRQDLGLRSSVMFFPAPQNNTYSVVAFKVDKQGLTFGSEGAMAPASMRAFGFVIKEDEVEGEQILRQMNMPFRIEPGEGTMQTSLTHSFGMTLTPGNYRLAWGVTDDASARITTVSESFEVPSFGTGEMMLTSVLMARPPMEQRTDAIDINTVYSGVRIGNIALDVDIDHTFARNDTIELLYFVMGVQVDPASRQPQLEVEHRVLVGESGDESIARLPLQTLNYFAIGQQVPLAQVSQIEPGGTYRIEIHVKDMLSGAELTYEVPFTVTSGSTP